MKTHHISVGIFCALVLASGQIFGQDYETTSANTTDNLTWAGTIEWSTAGSGGAASGNPPGSNAGGAATDNVIFSHHEAATGTQAYWIQSDVGLINNLDINGGTATGNSNAGDHVQLQIRNNASLIVDGTTTMGANEQASILLNQGGTATFALNGDLNIAAGASGNGLNSFINYTSDSATFVIGGDINGQVVTSPTNIGGIDLRLNSSNQTIFNTTGGTTTDTNSQTFNIDDFGVGLSGDNDNAIQTLGLGKIVNAEDLRVGENTSTSTANRTLTAEFTIDNTTVNLTDDALIGRVANGTGGTQIRSATGTVTLDNGALLNVGDDLNLGDGAATANTGQNAVGTLNVNGGSAVLVNDDVALGATDFAEGTVNVNDGSFTTTVGNINIGGNFSGTNADANSIGEFNVGAAGTLTVGDGNQEQHIFLGRDGLGTMNSNGTVLVTRGDLRLGDSTVATGEANTLNVTGGTFTVSEQVIVGLTAGNEGTINVSGGLLQSGEEIYLGGNATGGADDASNGTLNITGGGRVLVNDGTFGTNQNVEVGRDGAGFLTVDGGTLDIHTGNLVFGQANTVSNNSRGTALFDNGGTVNIGDTHVDGSNSDGLLNDFNINNGGADIVHTGAGTTVNVENSFQMQNTNAVAATNPNSSYEISESAVLNIGNDFNARAGNNTFSVIGGNTDVNIGDDFFASQPDFGIVFDFDGTSDSIFDFNFDVAGDANVNGASINLVDSGNDLATYAGDILLIDVGGSTNGLFANASEGQAFGGYTFTYMFNGTNSIGLIQAVPEPGTLAFLGLFGIGLMARRRRV